MFRETYRNIHQIEEKEMSTVSYGVSASGTLEKCRAKPENRGKGRCTHGDHMDIPQEQIANGAIEKFNEKIEEANAIKDGLGVTGGLKKTPAKSSPNQKIEKAGNVELVFKKKPGAEFTIEDFTEAEGYMGSTGWAGAKSGKGYRSNKDIAKDIRTDIKQATLAGILPSNVKYSITSDLHSINVNVIYPDASDNDLGIWENDPSYGPRFITDPKIKEVQDNITAIKDAYNYDGSNSQVDYFNKGFYGSVGSHGSEDHKSWDRPHKAKLTLAKLLKTEKEKGASFGNVLQSEAYFTQREAYVEATLDNDSKHKASRAIQEAVKNLSPYQKLSYEQIEKIKESVKPTEDDKVKLRRKVDESSERSMSGLGNRRVR